MILQISNVSKLYAKGKVLALDNINMTLTPGIYGLLGPNGAGKSTLINLLVGNLLAYSGTIFYNNSEITKLGEQYRNRLGYMPQQQGLYDDFSGERFLWYMAALKGLGKKQAKVKILELLELVNLHEHRHKKLSSYSGGMKQRILIAQALLNDPEVLILDEPTAGLDPKERINIRNFISTISINKVVIIATHVVTDIEFIAKEIILLKKGKLLMKNEPHILLKQMEGHVYEVVLQSIEQLEQLQKLYRISNIYNSSQGITIRIISKRPPEHVRFSVVAPNLEDLYLFHFD